MRATTHAALALLTAFALPAPGARGHDDPSCYEAAAGAGFYWCASRKSIETAPTAGTLPGGTVYIETRVQEFGEPAAPLWVYGVEDARPIKLYCEPGSILRLEWRALDSNGYPLHGWQYGDYQTC